MTTTATTKRHLYKKGEGEEPRCVIDRALVNADTLPMMKDIGLSFFASACSKNRGAFVLHPPDGKTYGCLAFPETILDMVGVTATTSNGTAASDPDGFRLLREREAQPEVEESATTTSSGSDSKTDVSTDLTASSSSSGDSDSVSDTTTSPRVFRVQTVEDINKHYSDGNLTSANVVDILDFLVDNVYQSTPSVEATPYACDVSGLVTLQCPSSTDKKAPIRAVTLAGVFTPALWATGGVELTLDQASTFYTADDFDKMKILGLNTVQIPVPVKMFSEVHKEARAWKDLLLHTFHQVRTAGLDAILLLEQGTSPPEDIPKLVETAAMFAQNYNGRYSDITIVAVTLPAMDSALLKAATLAAPDLHVWVPTKGGDFTNLKEYPSATGAALEFSHTGTVADIASSSSQEDRGKLFYHETMSCIARAPLEYSACYQDMPVMVANGFDLAIDDCHLRETSENFHDYGQCDRFEETIDSPWWKNHRYSFAARQLFAYEQGQGWSFAAWKLWNSGPDSLGRLDEPAKLLAFQEVNAAGLMPSLFDLDAPIEYPLSNQSYPVGLACLNPPANDFAMGDATFAPTPAPPPSCGNGWWNFNTEKCDYWIPPTPAPTPACPVCSNETVVCPPVINYTTEKKLLVPSVPDIAGNRGALAAQAFFSGAVLSAVICFIAYRIVSNNKRREYEEVPGNANDSNRNYQRT